MRRAALALLAALAGCYAPSDAFLCASADQCETGGQRGTCEPDGRCSYPDSTCGSGRRYGDAAGSVSGTCVGAGEPMPDAEVDLPDAAAVCGADGTSCGAVMCGDFGPCDWEQECDEVSTRSRSCTAKVCSGGACGDGPDTVDNQSCSRETEFISCTTNCGPQGGICQLGTCFCI